MDLSSTQLLYLSEMGIDVWRQNSRNTSPTLESDAGTMAVNIAILSTAAEGTSSFERGLLAWNALDAHKSQPAIKLLFVSTPGEYASLLETGELDYVIVIGEYDNALEAIHSREGCTVLLSETSDTASISAFKKTIMRTILRH